MNPLAKLVFGRDAADKVGAGTWLMFIGCLALLAWKAWAAWRINVNWDEFYFLTHVHALVRGDLEIPFQTVYTQAFRWLAWIGDSELPQIYVARLCMLALLAVAVVQIIRLGTRWVSPQAAIIAALAFLCFHTTQRHGASFRADSLLLPVLMGAILLLTRKRHAPRSDLVAGLLSGLGMAISVKMALFAPLLLACVVFADTDGSSGWLRWRALLARCLLIGAVTLATAALLIGLHYATLQVPPTEGALTFADRTFGKVIIDNHVSPGMTFLRGILRDDWFLWSLIGAGALLALWQRRWQWAAMVLSLIPIFFYRNAFPYFYVVMLGPPVVLIGLAVEQLRAAARRGATASRLDWLPLACGGLVLFHGQTRIPVLSADEQQGQRDVLEVVHAIFPSPVTYIDHSGMVSTFHKVNFFMSTWGMSDYQARGTPFVARAMRDYRPPLLVVNRGFLDARSPSARALLPEDKELLLRFYQPYWGHIYVAGTSSELLDAGPVPVSLPFPGRYRVESLEPVLIDGVPRQSGDVISAGVDAVRLQRLSSGTGDVLTVRLLWADARPRPTAAPQYTYIYNGL
jgi:hypothetical protein